jgi:integrase
MLARLYPIKHPRVHFAVAYTNPTQREKSGRAKRIVKTFVTKADAEEYQKTINKNMPVVGVRGLALDDAARADFHAARAALELAGVNLSLADVVRAWLSANPTRVQKELELDALLEQFIDHKRDVENCKERTTASLKSRLRAWFRDEAMLTVADLTREKCLTLRSRKGPSATTRKNDMNAASSFLSWLHECEIIPIHPLRGLRRPTADETKRVIWTVEEARAWFEAAARYRGGRFVPALVSLFFCGLRPSEQKESRFLLGKKPELRAEGGKLRGRANRSVPLCPAALAWLKAYPAQKDGGFEPITVSARNQLKKATGMPWAQDAARHTFISARAAIVKHEGEVAREAGTSVDIIHRHYHRLIAESTAKKLLGLQPVKRPTKLTT